MNHSCLYENTFMVKQVLKSLNDALKMINFIKSREIYSRLFSLLCKELSNDNKTLLLHSDVKWLLKVEIHFLMKNELNLARVFKLDQPFQLKETITGYFSEEETKYDWIRKSA